MKPSRVEVDLGALAENAGRLRATLGPSTALMLVVKADAYGHGAVPVVRRAVAEGVPWFAVAYVQEALAIRPAAGDARIAVLGVAEPAEVPALLEHRITPIVVDVGHGRALAAEARRAGRPLPVHVKIDTGMGRLGIHWPDAAEAGRALLAEDGLRVEGLCTHFARVEEGAEDPAREQMRRFADTAAALEDAAGRRLFKHVSSSRAMLLHGEWDLDAVRPGIIAYGYGAADPGGRVLTRPVLQWKASVAQVRRVPAGFPVGYYSTYVTRGPTTLAVLAAGYADGYLRTLSNKAHVLIGGRRCRVVGRVSMNWITVDAGPYAHVEAGDEAVLVGRQGNQEIWADELATLCRTIPYEILTNIHAAVPRAYIGS